MAKRLGLTAHEYTKIGKALRDAVESCERRYPDGIARDACIHGVKQVSEAMNKSGFQIGRKKR